MNELSAAPNPEKWSTAQIIEHLNFYARYYLDAINRKQNQNTAPPRGYFQSGWLGGYFTKLMKPLPDHTLPKKMKAPSNATPSPAPDAEEMLLEFLEHQQHLLSLLEQAKKHDINAIRIPISISPFIKLKLGDTYAFLIAHQERHLLQAWRNHPA